MSPGDPPSRRRLADSFDYGVPAGSRQSSSRRTAPSGPPGGGPSGGGPAGGGPSGGEPTPARRRRRRAAWAGGIAVTVVIALVVGAGIVANNKFGLINRLGLDGLDAAAAGAPRNYLVVGSDDRAEIDPDDPNSAVFLNGGDDGPSGQRADAILIMRVDPGAGKVDVLSIPRDLWVPIAGWDAEQRINTAYTEGAQQLIDTIRLDFDIEINNYVEIDFVGFQGLVDAVGGVPMWFDAPLRDRNSGLEVGDGCVTLDGYQSLAFVRSRYLERFDDDTGWETDPTGDAGRMSRQQVFVRRVLEQASREVSVTDIGAINQLADVAIDNVTLDSTLDLRSVLDLGRRFSSLTSENLVFHSLPAERWITPGGADVQLMDPVAAESVLSIFRGGVTREVTPRLRDLTVLNGTGTEGQATDVADALETAGFTVAETGNADGAYSATVVRYGDGGRDTAEFAARHFAGGADLEADPGLPSGSVVVVTGADLTRVLASPLEPDAAVLTQRSGWASPSTTVAPSGSGSSSTSPEASTSTTTTVPEVVGVIPGEPPEGVTCS